MCICDIDVAILFLILASVTTIVVEKEFNNLIIVLSSCWVQVLLPFCLPCRLNTNWSEKLSITLWPGESSEWRGVKEGKILLNLLSISTKWLLIRKHWHLVRKSSKAGCWDMDVLWGESMSDYMRWLKGSKYACSCNLSPSFWRWSLMDISLAIALILNNKKVLKAPKIHIVALLCIFPSIFK